MPDPNDQDREFARTLITAAKVAIGAPIGGIVGLLLGCYIPLLACMAIDALTGSQFGQIGWIALFVTAPGGLILGVVLGVTAILKRPWTFAALVVPVISLQLAYYILRETMNTPREYTFKVIGQPGKRFVGAVTADGKRELLKGTFPADFEFRANRIDLEFVLLAPMRGEEIIVEIKVDGRPKATIHSDQGVKGEFKSFGYAEWVGGTSSHTWVMDPMEAAEMRK